MKLSQSAAEIGGGDQGGARARGGVQPAAHRLAHLVLGHAVDDDLVHRPDAVGHERVVDLGAQGGSELMVGGGGHRGRRQGADLAAAADDPAGERQRDALVADRVDRRLRSGERARFVRAADHEVAASDAGADPDRVADEELPLHHRDPPEPFTGDHLAGLKAVAEVAQTGAERHSLLRLGQTVEARRRRAGHDALADAVEHPLADALAVHGEQQHRNARPAVRGPGAEGTRSPPRTCSRSPRWQSRSPSAPPRSAHSLVAAVMISLA